MKQTISRINNSFSGRIEIGGSKSISNRLLIIRGLASNNAEIENLSTSGDTTCLNDYLSKIETCERSGVPMIIDIGNAGTVARFLTAYLSCREGHWLITGSDRMKERPMKSLVDGLLSLGANITYPGEEGFLPLNIIGSDLKGNMVEIDATTSSQFISSLMLIGSLLENGLTIKFIGKPVSFSYIEMTAGLMNTFGAKATIYNDKVIVEPSEYIFHNCEIEPDWSSASYWYELVALSENGEIFLPGFKENSLQGDSILSEIFSALGVDTTFENGGIHLKKANTIANRFSFDFSGTPDIVPAVMTTCAALGIESEFINIDQLVFKESNRIAALKNELSKIGSTLIKTGNSYILSTKKNNTNNLFFNTYGDHRIAMCLSPLVLSFDNIEIENPEIVNKSYPTYWNDMKNLNFAHLKSITT